LKLFEHPDFEQAIIRAAEHFHSSGMREAVSGLVGMLVIIMTYIV